MSAWRQTDSLDTSSHLAWSLLAQESGWDPYAAWLDISKGQYLQPHAKELINKGSYLPIAVRAKGENNAQTISDALKEKIVISPSFGLTENFFSAHVAFEQDVLKALNTRAHFEFGLPSRASNLLNITFENWQTVPRNVVARDAEVKEVGRVILGMIDSRAAILNPRFFKSSTGQSVKSLIRQYWVQGSESAMLRPDVSAYVGPGSIPMWEKTNDKWTSGAFLNMARFDPFIDAYAKLTYSKQKEDEHYEKLGFPVSAEDNSHGTAVLDRALSAMNSPPSCDEVWYAELPEECLWDTGGNWASFYVINALRWMMAIAKDTDVLVVNLSLGASAGSHDGYSILEEAMDDMIVQARGRLQIIVSAGNFRKDRSHRRITLKAKSSFDLKWGAEYTDRSDAFLELWCPTASETKPSQHPSVNVTIKPLMAPDQDKVTPLVPPGACYILPGTLSGIEDKKLPAKSMIYSSVVPTKVEDFGYATPNGKGHCVLVAWGATKFASKLSDFTSERWTLTINNPHDFEFSVDAWLERRDVLNIKEKGPVSAIYKFEGVDSFDESNTLGTTASGEHTIVVGARLGNKTATVMCSFSSGGIGSESAPPVMRTARRKSPDLSAIGGEEDSSGNTMGVKTTGVRAGSKQYLAGTSLAAPIVSGLLIDVFRAQLKIMARGQLLALLKAKSPLPPVAGVASDEFAGDFSV